MGANTTPNTRHVTWHVPVIMLIACMTTMFLPMTGLAEPQADAEQTGLGAIDVTVMRLDNGSEDTDGNQGGQGDNPSGQSGDPSGQGDSPSGQSDSPSGQGDSAGNPMPSNISQPYDIGTQTPARPSGAGWNLMQTGEVSPWFISGALLLLAMLLSGICIKMSRSGTQSDD